MNIQHLKQEHACCHPALSSDIVNVIEIVNTAAYVVSVEIWQKFYEHATVSVEFVEQDSETLQATSIQSQ